MEVVIFCITLTAIMCVCLVAIGYIVGREVNDDVIDKNMDERADVPNSSELSDACNRDRRRSGDKSDYLGLDDEAVKGILYVMRMSVRYSDVERLAIDYCIDKLEGGEDE